MEEERRRNRDLADGVSAVTLNLRSH
jgi:hypothetical protein